jgi:hypothetical protein
VCPLARALSSHPDARSASAARRLPGREQPALQCCAGLSLRPFCGYTRLRREELRARQGGLSRRGQNRAGTSGASAGHIARQDRGKA